MYGWYWIDGITFLWIDLKFKQKQHQQNVNGNGTRSVVCSHVSFTIRTFIVIYLHTHTYIHISYIYHINHWKLKFYSTWQNLLMKTFCNFIIENTHKIYIYMYILSLVIVVVRLFLVGWLAVCYAIQWANILIIFLRIFFSRWNWLGWNTNK